MLEIKNLDIYVYPRYLIKNLSFNLNKGDKLAIIGEEGNGKSTLLKAILGKCEYANTTGSINFHNNKVGYLEQAIPENILHMKVHDFLFKDELDYYEKINNLYKYIEKLKLKDDILTQVIINLSGGEKVKIRLLKLLLEEPNILLLDEPTNDLDIETLEWLESLINNCNNPIIYISHDETLLSNTANIILHIEQVKHKTECRHTLLKIDYDTYVFERINKINKQTKIAKLEKKEFIKKEEKLKKVLEKVEHQQNTISRSDPHGAKMLKKKMHSLKSQESRLKKTELTELPDIEEGINFNFKKTNIPRTKKILDLNIKTLTVKNKILSKNIKLEVKGNEHICIIGKNGVGKSTLIKKIYEELKLRNDIKLGYMPQDYDEIFSSYDNVLQFISKSVDKNEITKARMYLGNMKFTHEEMTGKISNLSNGSKAKLILMKFVLEESNVLLLDEPTRNVSPLSNPIIREVLKCFDGTIISISHDRRFIDNVVGKIYELTIEGLILK